MNVLGNMTEATTLNELAVRRAAYGVIKTTFDYSLEFAEPVLVTIWTKDHTTRGRGDTEAEALDDAYSRLMHIVGALCAGHVLAGR